MNDKWEVTHMKRVFLGWQIDLHRVFSSGKAVWTGSIKSPTFIEPIPRPIETARAYTSPEKAAKAMIRACRVLGNCDKYFIKLARNK